ncbi:hypothetical protein [Spiroplasma endosymbiont of Amphimallon solstitiale]|uniref:hypothetical protein n=1 Tax=Spiroplasma endosymbiont of Amphimallon solstitiale TaxID=3066288 RepID=UPI00313B8722
MIILAFKAIANTSATCASVLIFTNKRFSLTSTENFLSILNCKYKWDSFLK